MSPPRVFVTGVSGYIGGHPVLHLLGKHRDWNIVTLVRDEGQQEKVLAKRPGIEVVVGSLDDDILMVGEGKKADVVLQTTSADHVPGVLALVKGLAQKMPAPGYFIHVGGTGMLNDVPNSFGNPSDKVYHDIADLNEITSLPVENHIHRDVKMAVPAANKEFGVPTAIVSPPMIHGVGSGLATNRIILIPFLVEVILKRGRGFQVLEGGNY